MLPVGYKGGFMIVPYREIAPAPSDETAALSLIRSVIERHVGRLEELLAEHEEIEAEEAAERYDRAALDCSRAFERHRRYQSARHRELMRTLDMLQKMRSSGMRNGEAEKADDSGQMADGKCQMADDECRTGDDSGEWRVASEIGVAVNPKSSGEPTLEECPTPQNGQNEANPRRVERLPTQQREWRMATGECGK
jgi:hypothetical protein